MRIALVGGTGSFGTALAVRLSRAGYDVVIGSRDADRARTVAAGLGVDGATNEDAVRDADFIVLTTQADSAVETARSLRAAIGTTPVLSAAAELVFTKGAVLPTPEATAIAERIQAVLDGPVVAGLHSLAASKLGDEDAPDEDTLVCGDDPDAKAIALELADKVVSGRAIDAGPLASARALEGMTAVIVNVNRRYKTHAGLRIVGPH